MIGGLSSSLALAQRTATKARATMDDMSRQIATGQRVSSVRDDGAAWARAAALKADRTQNEGRVAALDRVEAGLAYTQAAVSIALDVYDRLRGLALAAEQYAAGSTQRQQLQTEWTQTIGSVVGADATNPVFTNSGFQNLGYDNFGYTLSDGDGSFFSGLMFAVMGTPQSVGGWFDNTSFNGIALRTFDLANANTTQLATVRSTIASWRGETAGRWMQQTGIDLTMASSLRSVADRNIDRIDGAVSSLTDADLGKASAARSEAETRQQLALSTMRQAISAYGSYASGLLGNAQQTQRGILA